MALNHLADDTNYIYQALRDLTKDISTTDLVSFQQQTPAVQSVLVEEYLDNFPDLQLSRSQFEQLIHILHSNKNYYHILKNDYVLEKNYQNFRIYKIGPETYSQQKKIVIKSEGIFSYDSYIFL